MTPVLALFNFPTELFVPDALATARAFDAEMRARMQAEHDVQLERLLQARKVLTAEQLAKVPGIRKDCRGKRGDGPRGDDACGCGRRGPGPRQMDDAED